MKRKFKVSKQDVWHGGRRTVFDFEGYEGVIEDFFRVSR